MPKQFKPLLELDVLRRELQYEFEEFNLSQEAIYLRRRLEDWSKRTIKGETKIEGAFINRFFEETWGYQADGSGHKNFTLQQQFSVEGAGATGAQGSADLALGYFGEDGTEIPQVLCEFKGVGSNLDQPQNRKGSKQSAAEQGMNYLRHARKGFFGNEPVLPRFALVTDMNVFRLYWYDKLPDHYIQFGLDGGDLLAPLNTLSLLGDSDDAKFNRFLFQHLLRKDMLLSDYGHPRLERLIERQGIAQKKLEDDFYKDYRSYRLKLYNHVKLQLGEGVSEREKLRLAQRLLDRFIFIMFAEDMGTRIAFKPALLREQLAKESLDTFFDPEGTDVWRKIKRIFQLMNEGGYLGDNTIHKFNGGLFENDELLNQLELPNHVFCKRGQGQNEASTLAEKDTLLFLSANYNFASEGKAQNSIGLYTLGHIFEQSLVELDYLEAEAEGRKSLSEITKRKRDGVYYTPEKIVQHIILETVEPILVRWRQESDFSTEEPTKETTEIYWEKLIGIKIVDPACGSGAFLITAYQYLLDEYRRIADIRREFGAGLLEDSALSKMILANNIYGVDINPLSVEIAQLSLWLHTAYPRQPLSSFQDQVKVGNSLVDSKLFRKFPEDDFSKAALERIAVFDWEEEFQDVFANGGFDAVVGNPPYVKLQNFSKVYAETARYLREGVKEETDYDSTQSGNFDLYLPFIEKGLRLLNQTGRMGYIAPNIWPSYAKYGKGLREIIKTSRSLEKWIDFRSHQVFEDVTVYTAIQIYTSKPNSSILVHFVPTGDLEKVDWDHPHSNIDYESLAKSGAEWMVAPSAVRNIFLKLRDNQDSVANSKLVQNVQVGIQATKNDIYHLVRLGTNRYLQTFKDRETNEKRERAIEIEDGIMRPLVGGNDVKRFVDPSPRTYLLFPYQIDGKDLQLIKSESLKNKFPKTFKYLSEFEAELRLNNETAESGDDWYRYKYPKNLNKQEKRKVIVAQTVPEFRAAYDEDGEFYADNVRVNSIVSDDDGWFLLGCLNSPTVNRLFEWIGKPKDNGYFEANKQFIDPLPIPKATAAEKVVVADIAEQLQERYTRQKALKIGLSERLDGVGKSKWPYEKLLVGLTPKSELDDQAPKKMPASDKRRWVDNEYRSQLESAFDRIDEIIRLDSRLDAIFDDGELKFLVDEMPICEGIYLDDEQVPFILAQWQVVALDFEPKGKDDAKKLIDSLRVVGEETDEARKRQIIERQQELSELNDNLRALESELHEITVKLYGLTPAERRVIEQPVL